MKLIQKYPFNWFGEYSFELLENKIITHWHSLKGSSVNEFNFTDISPSVGEIVAGNSAWNNFGWFFLVVAALSVFAHIDLRLSLVLYVVTGVFFLIPIFKKEKVIFYKNKTNQTLFYIRTNNDN